MGKCFKQLETVCRKTWWAFRLLDAIPASKLPEAPTAEQAQLKYIALKVAEIKRRNQEKKIHNRFAYLRKLMQKDMEANAEEETAAAIGSRTWHTGISKFYRANQ
mgnify:CR=1 FL=1